MKLFGYEIVKQSALEELRRVLAEEQVHARRTLFLLQNGTLRTAPQSLLEARLAQTQYVYINPKTGNKIGFQNIWTQVGNGQLSAFTSFQPGKHTQWIFTELMPEGTAIHTNNLWE